jgi:hypothetical protein
MSNATGKPSTVWLKGEGIVKEVNAAGAITPGHIVLRGSAGTVTVAGAAAESSLMIALEQDTLGKDIDTAYASGDRVSCMYPETGCEIQGLLAAGATAVVIGSLLQTGAGGTVALRTTTNRVIGQALEAVDNSVGGTAVRLKWEKI